MQEVSSVSDAQLLSLREVLVQLGSIVSKACQDREYVVRQISFALI